jgi:molybdopterin/thiamine biosynthesis adenylyltransferase
MNPYVNIDFFFEKLQKLPMSVYEESDVIIAALDNFNARLDLNKICLRMKKPMVEGGTVGFEGHVQIVIPKDSEIEYKNREREIKNLVDARLWDITEIEYPEYFKAQARIEGLEEEIERIREEKINPVETKIRKEIEMVFDWKYAPEILDQTPCYRCLVPIPPADDKLVAACTLKGLPRNRNHCVIKAEVEFEKKYGHKPDLNLNDEVLKLKEIAQIELDKLRERVFNENVAEEERESLTVKEIEDWKTNINDTFGPDYKFEEMENILGNKIAAIQTVSSIISSIESQEALKLLFRVNGRNIGNPMEPPYVNYNGIYGQFDHLHVLKRDDCLACGKIEGEENVQLVVPFDADVGYIFKAMGISEHKLDPELWMITNPMTKEIYWNPYMPSLKDPDIKLASLKIKSNDIITLSPLGKALAESEIKKYNVVIAFM